MKEIIDIDWDSVFAKRIETFVSIRDWKKIRYVADQENTSIAKMIRQCLESRIENVVIPEEKKDLYHRKAYNR